MPVAAARKIEFFVRKRNPDLDIQLVPVVLTLEQCEQYALPRTPIKATEKRAEAFEARFGEGATELDALEALHPGELARILEAEIARFHDSDLDAETRQAARPVRAELDRVTERVQRRHSKEIAALRKEYQAIIEAHQQWEERATPIWRAMAEEIEAAAEPVIEAVDWPEPTNADDYDDPLFDSTRDYVDQINRYKAFQGKTTERKPLKAR